MKDFREILADKSIDAVCISTPDHWHAYMTVEACKAGKDVYVEKPACVYVEEGKKMVQAARKYKRVVQAGTMQRSGGYFQKAAEMVRSGRARRDHLLPHVAGGATKPRGLWQPAGRRAARRPRLGPVARAGAQASRSTPIAGASRRKRWSTFRYFWDYAGGAMTDWGVHLLDIVQFAFDEAMPTAVAALGSRSW